MNKIYTFLVITLIIGGLNNTFSQSYNESDKNDLRKFLRQSSSIANQLNLEQLGLTINDTINWVSDEAWLTNLTGITWNSDSQKKILEIRWDNTSLSGDLDVNACDSIQILFCQNNPINNINVSSCAFLQKLYCFTCNLSSIDVSNNSQLIELICSENNITSLSLLNNSQLKSLFCSYNNLNNLDISNCAQLKTLYCISSNLNSLNISNNTLLQTLDCSSNNLTNLDISLNTSMTDLKCYENNLKFSTLPLSLPINTGTYSYSPQNSIDGGSVNANQTIDLSSEAMINSNPTVYTWFNGTTQITPTSDNGNGVFTFDNSFANQTLTCKMTNTVFPDFEGMPITYSVTINPVVGIESFQDSKNTKFYVANDLLYIESDEHAKVCIYKYNGTKLLDLEIYNSDYIYLSPGFYIITINGKAHKVVL